MRETRIQSILKIVRERADVSPQDLADEMGVSLSTVRRDLAELSSRNLVAVSKNGVFAISETVADTPIHLRSKLNSKVKGKIAAEALSLISNGNTIFLDSSSTVLGMVDGLRSFHNLVIITNSIYIATRLYNTNSAVHLLGGEMSPSSHGFFGSGTMKALQNFNPDLAFISPVAVTPMNYAAQTTEDSAGIRRMVIGKAARSVLLFDHTKIGLTRPYNIAHLSAFAHIITDDKTHQFDTDAIVHRIDP